MNASEKKAYRSKYLRLTKEYEILTSGYNCGNQLMEFINPRIQSVRQEIDELVEEIKSKMKGGN